MPYATRLKQPPTDLKEIALRWYEDVLSGTVASHRGEADDYMDVLNKDLSLLFSKDFVNHWFPAPPEGWKTGVAAAEQIIRAYRMSAPNLEITVDEQKVIGNVVFTYFTVSGTHMAKAFLGVEASGKRYRVKGFGIDRIEDGKFVESWGNWDICGLMEQMGMLGKKGKFGA